MQISKQYIARNVQAARRGKEAGSTRNFFRILHSSVIRRAKFCRKGCVYLAPRPEAAKTREHATFRQNFAQESTFLCLCAYCIEFWNVNDTALQHASSTGPALYPLAPITLISDDTRQYCPGQNYIVKYCVKCRPWADGASVA